MLDDDGDEIGHQLDGWDFGLSSERRVYGNLWLKVEAGIGGLRGLSLQEGDWVSPDVDVDSSGYLRFGISFRPELE